MNNHNMSAFKKRTVCMALAATLSFAPWVAEAAGLGRITVLTALGQPLRAEVEINASHDEIIGMTARIAPAAVFQQAGVDYSSALSDLRLSIERKANGKAVVKLTSSRPVNEPFLDFLVELNWPAGRLVREYTFLLDPPELQVKSSGRPVSVAEAKLVETVRDGGEAQEKPAQPSPVPQPVRSEPAAKPVVARQSAPAPKVAEAAVKKEIPASESGETRTVHSGDTLRKIASETKYENVSLEQMLVGLFRANPDAFVGNNVNRLKAGAILNLPDKAAVESIPEAEAKKIYLAQSRDWNAYRQKLAGAAAAAPAKDEGASQASSGKIAAKVEEKTPVAEQAKDQVKVSRTESSAKNTGKAGGDEDRIAREKSLKEAQERVALLEKNVNDLQKLVELKNQKLAELQQKPPVKEEPKATVVAPAKPAEPPVPAKPVEEVKPPVVESKPAEPPKTPEVVKPVEETKPAEAAKPVETPPPPKKVVLPPEPEPEPEPGFLEEMAVPLGAGLGVLALLGGFMFWRKRRPKAAVSPSMATVPGPSSLGPNSVFRMTGGQSIDTSATPPQTGEFSQTGPGTIDTDEVDPVAEADVYMAYGRDAQAEEILIEALQKDPQRIAIHAKLLEIYANRKSLKQFETLASELYAQTAGVGPEWERVATLGAQLDPENPLYSGGGKSESKDFDAGTTWASRKPVGEAAKSFDADATLIVSPEAAAAARSEAAIPEVGTASIPGHTSTLVLDTAVNEPELADATAAESSAEDDLMSLDFDLGAPEPTPAEVEVPAEEYVDTITNGEGNALDFDLDGVPEVATVEPVAETLDLAQDALTMEPVDLDIGGAAASEEVLAFDAAPDFSPAGTLVMPGVVEGDPELLTDTFVGLEKEAEAFAAENDTSGNLVDFDLDVDGESATSQGLETVVNPLVLGDEPVEEVVEATPVSEEVPVDIGEIDGDSLEFDVKLTESTFLGMPNQAPSFDMGAINLDLASPPEESAASPVAEPEPAAEAEPAAEDAFDPFRDEVSTKLDLARAYEEMGDLEGARELLNEVVGEGPPDLVEQAREILARVG